MPPWLWHIQDTARQAVRIEATVIDFLRQHLGAEGDNCCELFFRLRDHANGKYVMLRSNKLIAVDKRLMDALHEAGIECQVNARV